MEITFMKKEVRNYTEMVNNDPTLIYHFTYWREEINDGALKLYKTVAMTTGGRLHTCNMPEKRKQTVD